MDLAVRLERCRGELPPVLLRVAEYFDQNRFDVLAKSALALGEATGTSDATIIRAAKALGYEGLSALRRELAEEMAARRPAEDLGETIRAAESDVSRAIQQVMATGRNHLDLLGSPVLVDGVQRLAERLHSAQRIALFGVGPTSHLVGYMAAQLRRRGRRVHLLVHTGSMLADDLAGLAEGDVLLALSYGQPYPEIEISLAEAQRIGVPVLLITDQTDSPLRAQVEQILVISRRAEKGVALQIAAMAVLDSLVTALSVLADQQAIAHLQSVERLRRKLTLHESE